MDKVFDITRQLAKALMESDEYAAMKRAEEEALADAQAAELVGKLMEYQSQLADLINAEPKDTEKINAVRLDMLNAQQNVQALDVMSALSAARERFDGLIDQVNQVLQFEITGIPASAENVSGCTGSCATCPGCH